MNSELNGSCAGYTILFNFIVIAAHQYLDRESQLILLYFKSPGGKYHNAILLSAMLHKPQLV